MSDHGVRSFPKKKNIINKVLIPKIMGTLDSQVEGLIPTVDIHNREPSELPYKLCFFSRRVPMKGNGSRRQYSRTTKTGYWKSTCEDKNVMDCNKCIGKKKTLVFYTRSTRPAMRTVWIMYEFSLPCKSPPHEVDDLIAVYFLKKNKKKTKKNKADTPESSEGREPRGDIMSPLAIPYEYHPVNGHEERDRAQFSQSPNSLLLQGGKVLKSPSATQVVFEGPAKHGFQPSHSQPEFSPDFNNLVKDSHTDKLSLEQFWRRLFNFSDEKCRGISNSYNYSDANKQMPFATPELPEGSLSSFSTVHQLSRFLLDSS